MKWIFPEQNNTPLLPWLYKQRNIVDKKKFSNPSFDDLHDPFLMHDMDKAVSAIKDAIKNNKKIFIHGDFDVDGITATSIMWTFLYKELNANALPYIPNRFTEGYGLSEESIDAIIAEGGNLIITVDCGVKDIELVARYSDRISFIITDHHTIRSFNETDNIDHTKKVDNFSISSKALAVVHPQLNKDYPFKEICGAVVSWKVCSALNNSLGTGVNMQKYLSLAALGTVCDVMPLVNENRVIVKLGLSEIRNGDNLGLNALINIAKANKKSIESYHLGYILGPRLNASGRLGSAMDGVRLLTTNSSTFADELAVKLENLNMQRRELTVKYMQIADELISKMNPDNKMHVVVGDEWPEGILGLIAGKLTEKYRKPVIIGSRKEDFIKASARSTENFNIAEALKSSEEFLLRHGGHAQAAGLSLNSQNQQSFTDFITNYANKLISDHDTEKTFSIDAIANISEIDSDLIGQLNDLGPFGYMNQQPLIALRSALVKNHISMGKDKSHLKLFLVDNDNNSIECVGFGMMERFNSEILNDKSRSSAPLDIAGYLEINEWNGNQTVSLRIQEFRFAE